MLLVLVVIVPLLLLLSSSDHTALLNYLSLSPRAGDAPSALPCVPPSPGASAAALGAGTEQRPYSDMGCASIKTIDFERQLCFRRGCDLLL